MNFVFWFSCNKFWDASMDYAVKFYLWEFVNDFFGNCGASGYILIRHAYKAYVHGAQIRHTDKPCIHKQGIGPTHA